MRNRINRLILSKNYNNSEPMNKDLLQENGYQLLGHDYWAIPLDGNYFVFNSFSGEPFIVDENEFHKIGDDAEIEGIDYSDAVKKRIISVGENYIRNYPNNGLLGLDLLISEVCNLKCPMCFHGKIKINSSNSHTYVLSFENAKKWIDFYLDYADTHNIATYVFHIGSAEPFLFKNNIWEIVNYIRSKVGNHDTEIVMNTNLTLIDDDDVKKNCRE